MKLHASCIMNHESKWRLRHNKGQTTLEICIAIVVGILLITGAVSVWNYYGKIKVDRMDEYRATRATSVDFSSGNIGQQLAYREPNDLDIFSMLNTIGPGSGGPGLPGPYPPGPCYDEYNASMNLSGTLIQEAEARTLNIGNYLRDSVRLKSEFSMMRIWLGVPFWWGSGTYWTRTNAFMVTWLYGSGSSGGVFDNSWSQIGIDFDNKISSVLAGSYSDIEFQPQGFWCNPNTFSHCFTRDDVWNVFIAPGIDLERKSVAANLEASIKNGLAILVLKLAEAKYNACRRAYEGKDTTCDNQCGSYLTQAEAEINNSITQVNNGLLAQAQASFQQADSLLNQYETCFINCSGVSPWNTNPCHSQCKAEYDAFIAKTKEAQTALAEGRLGDAQRLTDEAQILYNAYLSCYNACTP